MRRFLCLAGLLGMLAMPQAASADIFDTIHDISYQVGGIAGQVTRTGLMIAAVAG